MNGSETVKSSDLYIIELTPLPLKELLHLLSEDEQIKAERFKIPQKRESFIKSRGTLRKLLSARLHKKPQEIKFQYAEKGKPFTEGLEFNISHSEELLAVVIGTEPIGVDIEKIRHNPDIMKIADRYFHKNEAELLQTIPPARLSEVFHLLWCAKEAYAKLSGNSIWSFIDMDFSICCELTHNIKKINNSFIKQFQLQSASKYCGAVASASNMEFNIYFYRGLSAIST